MTPEQGIDIEIESQDKSIREILTEEFPDIEEETLKVYELLEEISPELLYPPTSEPSEEDIEKYTLIHSQIHEEMTKQILSKQWEVLVLESGMFGGKSSLGFSILDQLKEMEYTDGLYIASVMGEKQITARACRKGKKERKATVYGELNPKLRLPLKESYRRNEDGKLRKVRNNKRVVLFDEFSFENEKYIKKMVRKCKDKNVKLILMGLNRNHLGQILKPFKNIKEIVGKNSLRVNCKSFVPGIDGDEPTGTHSVRYVKLGDKEIIDLGLLPDIVSKEAKNKSGEKIVRYAPAKAYMVFMYMFRDSPEILDYVLNPLEKQIENRKERLEELEKR